MYVHQCCPGVLLCPCWDTCDPHILDDANLPDGPGLFLGEQHLVGSQFNLPMIHSDFALPEVFPAPPLSGVLPDRYIPDLAYDSDSPESIPAIFPPEESIANDGHVINLDHLPPLDNSNSDADSIHLLDLD